MPVSKKESFKGAFSELEKIVADFEGQDLDLEDALPKFERGMELAKKLRERLKQVENKVTEIKKKYVE